MIKFFILVLICNLTLFYENTLFADKKIKKDNLIITSFFKGTHYAWGMSFLPDGQLLVSEKPGRLLLISKNGKKSWPIKGLPQVQYEGQGGLLDIAVDPQFVKNKYIYISYSEPNLKGFSGTTVARAKLKNKQLSNLKVIWQQSPKVKSTYHWGSRIIFDKNENLFITTGDRYNYKDHAQKLNSTIGKTIRIKKNGTIPQDNPFLNTKNVQPEIWSYGHRNVQGAALNPLTKELWTHQHGAKGGDEINIDRKGKNYGWPIITYGKDYSGDKIGEGTRKKGMEQPLHYWDPSIAPSGMIFYTGQLFPQWKNNIFLGSLKFTHLRRVVIENNKVLEEHKLLIDIQQRVRDVEQGPDGAIYVAFDSAKGDILRLAPKGK